MPRSSSWSRLAAVSGASVLALAVALPAQAADPAADVIIVTAQKKEESLQEVALALDVIQEDKLENITAAGRDILALSGRAPSLYGESSFGRTFPRFYIRGYGNTDFDLNANQPVAMYYDGVVLENPALKGFPIFDLDRVEVLRGPQGTLFGRNTPAGIIKLESARPTETFEGYARAAYATFDTIDAEGAVSGPISDSLSFRLSGLYQSRDDVAENLNDDAPQQGIGEFEETAGRAQLLYEPSEAFSALLNVHARKLDGGSQIFRANVIQPGGGLVPGFDFETYDQDAVHFLELTSIGGSLTIEADLGFGQLTSVTGYESLDVDARGDVDGGTGAAFLPSGSSPGFIPFPAETSDAVTDHGQYSQELRLAFSPAEKIDATVGLFFFREELEIDNVSYNTLAPGRPVNGFGVQNQTTQTFALFGSATYQVTDALSLTGGLRISFEDKEFSAERLISPFGAGPLGPLTRDLDDTVVTGDLTAEYQLTPDAMIYGRYARGFRAPNVQGRILFGDVVTVADTETIDSFEVGTKKTLADGRGRVSATAYVFNTNDQQLTAVGGAGNFNQLLNAEGVQGYGFELDGAFRPTERTEITLGYSYNDTEIQDEDLTVAACGAPCQVNDPLDGSGLALIDGNPLPQAAEHILIVTFEATQPVGPGELFFFTDTAHRSEVNFFLYESPEFTGGALTETGLRAGFRHDEGWEVSFFGRNIFDEQELVGAVDFNNLTGFVNEPRIWGAEVVARF
jgi:iron complex outermembrane receptor protein